MYIYFDVNGNLKEVIQEPVREGSYNHNKVYIYVESGNVEPINNMYHLPSAYTNAKANFKLLDTNQSLNPGGNSVSMTKLTNVEIPYNEERDLYFFKYGYKYEMWYMELPETVTEVDGVVSMTTYLYNMSNQLALNTYNFNVESSVGVTLDSTMTQAQYSYLYNTIFGSCVMFDSDGNLDLGSHSLKFNDSYIYEDENHNLNIGTGIGKIVLAPETYVEYYGYEIANKNDLPKKLVIATFNTNSFTAQSDGTKRLVILNIQNYISNSDLLVITWGGCFAICPIPQSGPGRVCAALWNANGESEITRIRYQLDQLESGLALTITLPGNFQLPNNFTGYVINYKIV